MEGMGAISNGAAQCIVVLGTGGTIAGSGGTTGGNIDYEASTIDVNELLDGIMAPPGYELLSGQVAQLDSKDMDFAVWRQLTQRYLHWLAQPDVAGIVITHGRHPRRDSLFPARGAGTALQTGSADLFDAPSHVLVTRWPAEFARCGHGGLHAGRRRGSGGVCRGNPRCPRGEKNPSAPPACA
jgi:hypothetical protein